MSINAVNMMDFHVELRHAEFTTHLRPIVFAGVKIDWQLFASGIVNIASLKVNCEADFETGATAQMRGVFVFFHSNP
jgi:hypothetical protein